MTNGKTALGVRAAAALLAAASLLLPAASWRAAMSWLELAAEAALAALALLYPARGAAAWRLAMGGLFAGDLLYNLQFRLNLQAPWLYPAEGLIFILYAAALIFYLAGPYRGEAPPEPAEKKFLAAVLLASLYVSARYVLLPYFQSGNNPGDLNHVLAVAFRVVQAAAIALAFGLSLKADSAYWLCLTHGVLLLSLSSVAIGYSEAVTLGQEATFHEYGWLWGLLLLLFGRSLPEPAAGAWSRWDSVRVRLAWLVFLFNLSMTALLYWLGILVIRDAYQFTSLLFIGFALWTLSNFIALQVSLTMRRMLDGLRGGSEEAEPPFLRLAELSRFAESLREAYARIERQSAMAAIGQTAATMAHDLRRPFARVKALLSSLDSLASDPAALASGRESVEKDIAHADSMIGDLLDYSRAARPALSPESLRGVLELSVRQAAAAAPGAALELRWDLRHTRKPLADAARLARAVSNLLSNAAEAVAVIGGRSSGTITVGSRDARAGGADLVELSVANDGPPIPGEDLPRLFSAFFTKGKPGGTGLGLASVRKTAELHGGTVSARNLPGGAGAEFSLLLPASKEQDAPGGPLPASFAGAAAPAAGTAGARRVALACDDDPLSRECAALHLGALPGAASAVFASAEELLAWLKADLAAGPAEYTVFTDQNMGGMTGLQLTAALRALGLPRCRVFLVCNEPQDSFAPRALAAGADGSFAGPLDRAVLARVFG